MHARHKLLGILVSIITASYANINLNQYNNLVILGDSLSDNGNLYSFTKKASLNYKPMPKSPPYNQGMFSDGPVWNEILFSNNHVFANLNKYKHLHNYAVGGSAASINNVSISNPGLPYALKNQRDYYKFLNLNKTARNGSNSIYVVEAGPNDYLNLTTGREDHNFDISRVEHAVNAIRKTIEFLANNGAKYILVSNVPDLGRTPSGMTFDSALFTKYSKTHNELLDFVIKDEQQKYTKQLVIRLIDTAKFFDEELSQYKNEGLDITIPCYSGGYAVNSSSDIIKKLVIGNTEIKNLDFNQVSTFRNANEVALEANNSNKLQCTDKFFFDKVHPTARVHQNFANYIEDLIKNLPEIKLVKFSNHKLLSSVTACIENGQCISNIKKLDEPQYLTINSNNTKIIISKGNKKLCSVNVSSGDSVKLPFWGKKCSK